VSIPNVHIREKPAAIAVAAVAHCALLTGCTYSGKHGCKSSSEQHAVKPDFALASRAGGDAVSLGKVQALHGADTMLSVPAMWGAASVAAAAVEPPVHNSHLPGALAEAWTRGCE